MNNLASSETKLIKKSKAIHDKFVSINFQNKVVRDQVNQKIESNSRLDSFSFEFAMGRQRPSWSKNRKQFTTTSVLSIAMVMSSETKLVKKSKAIHDLIWVFEHANLADFVIGIDMRIQAIHLPLISGFSLDKFHK